MKVKIFISILLFLLVGELFIRIDKKYQFLSSNHEVKIATTVEVTQEFISVNNNSINFAGKNLRIMVLGDSYIHGGGVKFTDNFSQQLKYILIKNNIYFDSILILDISRPSSNSLDNTEAYFQFVDKFKPHIVILGYNYNDVLGNLEKTKNTDSTQNFAKSKTNSNKSKSSAQKLYDVLFKSELLRYVLGNSNTELKAHGIIIPNTEFGNIMTAYTKNKPNWQKSKLLLNEMFTDAKNKNIEFLTLKFPEMNLLQYPSLFKSVDDTIKKYFNGINATHYINITDIFKGESATTYLLSKYDGHPNELAHTKIAKFVFDSLKTFPCCSGKFN